MPVEQTKETQKKISIKEFKMWLQGVEEMQADGWTPDARQWERIRAKIDQIDDNVTSPPPYTGIRSAEQATLPPGMEAVFPPMNIAPPASGGGTAVPLPSGLHVQAPPARVTRAGVTPSGMPVSISGGSPTPVKTPDVDTSNGKPYNSSFA